MKKYLVKSFILDILSEILKKKLFPILLGFFKAFPNNVVSLKSDLFCFKGVELVGINVKVYNT